MSATSRSCGAGRQQPQQPVALRLPTSEFQCQPCAIGRFPGSEPMLPRALSAGVFGKNAFRMQRNRSAGCEETSADLTGSTGARPQSARPGPRLFAAVTGELLFANPDDDVCR